MPGPIRGEMNQPIKSKEALMNLSITARGYKAPDRLKQYISSRLNRKKRVYEGIIDADVILSYEKQTQVAEIKAKLNDKLLITIEKSENVFKSIDMALDKLELQIKRHNDKRRNHKKEKIVDNLVV